MEIGWSYLIWIIDPNFSSHCSLFGGRVFVMFFWGFFLGKGSKEKDLELYNKQSKQI